LGYLGGRPGYDRRVTETGRLAEHFAAGDSIFVSSPLYRSLCRTVAGDQPVLDLLAQRRPGQQPSFLLFGAVHYLLLSGAAHPLGGYYPSLHGAAAADPSGAGPPLLDFCRAYRDELAELIRSRRAAVSRLAGAGDGAAPWPGRRRGRNAGHARPGRPVRRAGSAGRRPPRMGGGLLTDGFATRLREVLAAGEA
jgi:hypothetical protein